MFLWRTGENYPIIITKYSPLTIPLLSSILHQNACFVKNFHFRYIHHQLALVAQVDAHPTEDHEVAESSLPNRQHSFMEIDHEIFSTVILFLPLIQEGQLSVSGKRMCTILVNRLED